MGRSVTFQQQHPPPAGVALSYPAAQEALIRLRRFWRRCTTISGIVALSCLGVMLLCVVVGLAVGGDLANRIIGGVALLAFLGVVISGALALVALPTLRKIDRMEWTMSRFPWVERYQYSIRGGRSVVVVIGADQHGPEAQGFATGGFGWSSIERIQAGAGHQPLLVSGDPRREAVITTPAMQDLYLVRPSRM